MLLEQLLGDVTRGPCPVLGRLVQDVHDIELAGILLLERVELAAEEDILFSDVREEQSEFGPVRGGGERVGKDLVKWRAIVRVRVIS